MFSEFRRRVIGEFILHLLLEIGVRIVVMKKEKERLLLRLPEFGQCRRIDAVGVGLLVRQ